MRQFVAVAFSLYIALGDSMSTDHYPTSDVRSPNDDARWPEFRGRDLEELFPGVEFLNLAEDGAMIDDVTTDELSRFGRDSNDPAILFLADSLSRGWYRMALGGEVLGYLHRSTLAAPR
jgi:hypothetical protein